MSTPSVVVIPQQASNFFPPKSILSFFMLIESKGTPTDLMQIWRTIHAHAIPYHRSTVGVDDNFDGRECRRCDGAACSLCASGSCLCASAVHLDRILSRRQHWGSLAQR